MAENQSLPINNPAERLYVILSRASQAEHNRAIEQVLCEAMEIKNNEFIRKYGELFDLINHIEKQIQKKFPSLKQRGYIALLNDIRYYLERVIRLVMGDQNKNKWSSASPLNNPNWVTLQSFGACVHDFEEYKISINDTALNTLIDEVETLMNSVKESDLNDDLKNFVITKLLDLKQTLEKYYYYGNEEVKKEIYSTLLEVGLIQNEIAQDNQTEENKKLWRRIIESLSKWANIINAPLNTIVIADKLPPIITQTSELISNTIKHLPPSN